jgi:UDP:flavonoid glycosyltransferase YjiC (YdhE family)
MRVLVSTTAGSGHFGPLVPFATALRDAGHDVAVAAPASFGSAVEASGFPFRPFADAPEEELRQVFAGLQGMSFDEGNTIVIRDMFGRVAPRAALPGVRQIVAEWQPQLILRETGELASYVVARATGIPFAEVGVGLSEFDMRFAPVLDAPLAELGAKGGVAPLLAAPRVCLVPEILEDPKETGSHRTLRFRDDSQAATGDPLPDWWGTAASGPLVYVTFGSVAADVGLFPEFYKQILAALADVPVRVLVTVGRAADPQLLEPLPANAHVERWWPQQHVMRHAAAMVGHGGFGTTLAGLVAGVPMVVMPLFADQPYNAARVVALGAGISLEGGPAAVGRLPDALRSVLDDDSFRANARRVADEVDALPPVSRAVPFLESLTAS